MKKLSLFLAGLAVLGSVALAGASVVQANEDGDRNSKQKNEKNKAAVMLEAALKVKAEDGMKPEAHITVNGKVLVRGAKITAISGNTMSAQVAWGSYVTNWTVNASDAHFIRRHGGNSSLAEFSVGDVISFSGILDTSSAVPTVNADIVKNWSLGKKDVTVLATLQGELKALSSTTLPAILTVKVKDQDFTVNATASTAILNRNWGTLSLNSFAAGDTVRFYGAITGTTATATVIRNVSK